MSTSSFLGNVSNPARNAVNSPSALVEHSDLFGLSVHKALHSLYREDAQLKDVLEKYYIKLTPKNSRVSASLAKTYKQ